LLLTVRDDAIIEADDMDSLWSRDSFEIFMAARPGAAEYLHAMISPGVSPKQTEVRTYFNPKSKPPLPLSELTLNIARKAAPGGYLAEVLIPWKNLKFTPKSGDEVAFQLMVNDYDDRPRSKQFNAVWFP